MQHSDVRRSSIPHVSPLEREAAEQTCNGIIRSSYKTVGSRTFVECAYELGSLRLRHLRGVTCHGVVVNTGGGILGGDRFSIDVELKPRAHVTFTSSAAEKIYRSDRAESALQTRLRLEQDSNCIWIPQETILFDRARFRREIEIDLAASASLFAAEIVVFGRTAHGERDVAGSVRDRWRVRRNGRLIYADETWIGGSISAVLASKSVTNGAHAMAAILIAGKDSGLLLDRMRAAISSREEMAGDRFEGAVTLRERLVIGRLLSNSPERLRTIVAAMLQVAGRGGAPRSWL